MYKLKKEREEVTLAEFLMGWSAGSWNHGENQVASEGMPRAESGEKYPGFSLPPSALLLAPPLVDPR